jgi:hypothetical protein
MVKAYRDDELEIPMVRHPRHYPWRGGVEGIGWSLIAAAKEWLLIQFYA